MKYKFSDIKLSILIASLCALIACSGKQNGQPEGKHKITLTKVNGSPEYAKASLSLTQPTESRLSQEKNIFDFEVVNFSLGIQTADARTKGLANSGKGQHIHFILDNDPYSAHYESTFVKSIEAGNHVMLAFLSRSYHESVKNPNAFVIKQWQVGEVDNDEQMDLSKPHMFYSRPKGIYEGSDTEKLLLDFYLINTDLSPNGNKVRATINNAQFMIDKWAPYQIEGLSPGKVSVKLELLNADGELIDSPFNPVERKVILKE